MTDMENIVTVVLGIALLAFLALLAAILRMQVRREKGLRDELDALWRRVEWLCRDTDDRLSADRVAIQRVSIRARSLHKRVRRCEKELYIAADGTDAEEDGV